MNRRFFFAVFLLGVTAMAAQIVFLRQLVTAFYGNEVSLGFMLGAWLLWGAAGSWFLGRFSDRIKDLQFSFAGLQIVLALFLPVSLLIVRNARGILGVLPGEIIGFLPMLIFSFAAFSLICLILGFLFTLACRIYPLCSEIAPPLSNGRQVLPGFSSEARKDTGEATGAIQIGRVYIFEALGAVCGGCLVSFFLIRYLDGLYIILGLAGLNLISALSLLRRLRSLALILIIGLAALFVSQKAKELKQISLENQWKGFTLLAAEDSIYSNLIVTEQKEQHSFFSNGSYLFTVPNEAAVEEAVHFALLEVPDPQSVLLIGGGMAGLAEEVLKHPVSALDYVELDPKIIDLGRRFLPTEGLAFLMDKRLRVLYRDGRLFVEQMNSAAKPVRYDCVIVYLGDPYTAQINRFYTREFFQEVKRCLKPDGVFSFGIGASENFINKEQQQLLSAMDKTLKEVFAEVRVIPGDTAYFLAAERKGRITFDCREISRRLKKRNIKTKFVNKHYLSSRLSPDRLAYLEGMLQQEKKAGLNTDFRPISYYYDMVLWSTHFTEPGRKLLSRINQKGLWGFFALIYCGILMFGFLGRGRRQAKRKAVILAVCTTGLTELSFQVVILLAFQIIYGYLYYKLGIILSFFMIGLLGGSWLITERLKAIKNNYGLFLKTQIAIVLYPLILPGIFYALNSASGDSMVNWIGSNIIFPVLPVISGFIGGVQFPLANRIILRDMQQIGQTAGLSYGMDLLGACLGALLVSAFLVPILGITQTSVAIATLNFIVLVILMMSRRKQPIA